MLPICAVGAGGGATRFEVARKLWVRGRAVIGDGAKAAYAEYEFPF